MNFLLKLPGPFIVFLGACALSFGGLIVKSFEGSSLWQILFWRSLFFSIVVFLFLISTHKTNFFNSLIKIGSPGLIGGIILAGGYAGYVFAMYNTTVTNANFIIQTQTIFLALFGYIFLREKISKLTLISIMLGGSLTAGQMVGNIAAFLMPISFAVLILIVRKFPDIDMVPLQLIAGLGAMTLGYFFSSKIIVSSHDIILGFVAGFFQVGLGFILITIGARKTPSALVGIIMLTEAVLGPLWAWIFINENPPLVVLFGGSIILFAVFLQFFNRKIEN